MIDIKVIGSGSSGNCYLVNINNTKILLEAGLPFKKIQQAMNFKLRDIEACLITHDHMDHAKSIKELMKSGIDCYITRGTAEALEVSGHRLNCFTKDVKGEYCWKFFNRLGVKPFKSIHDVKEPVSFFINDVHTKESLVFITDTAYLKYKIPDVDVLMVECNYVKSILDKKVEDGILNVTLRNRIVRNHMSLETLLEALKVADLSKLKKIYVLHLSDSNSDENLILEAIQKATGVEVEVC
ncbi:MBL fold metallo-hydrolase [Helcococcus kunzii]|uniref:MBL fold metallo-hydrolase n=1 Tax=Helcococcus kunzii TaxID=40091 RepID=UPI0024AD8811|nr:MBL fold metallo-hydrolase [Helcococcus kunzii]